MDRSRSDDVSEFVTGQVTLEGMAACLVIPWVRLGKRWRRKRERRERGRPRRSVHAVKGLLACVLCGVEVTQIVAIHLHILYSSGREVTRIHKKMVVVFH